jgi:hypothetical protein
LCKKSIKIDKFRKARNEAQLDRGFKPNTDTNKKNVNKRKQNKAWKKEHKGSQSTDAGRNLERKEGKRGR